MTALAAAVAWIAVFAILSWLLALVMYRPRLPASSVDHIFRTSREERERTLIVRENNDAIVGDGAWPVTPARYPEPGRSRGT